MARQSYPAGLDLATLRWLLYQVTACRTCGEAHAYRDTTPPGRLVRSGTWAHPDDGHTYQRPLFNHQDAEDYLRKVIAEVDGA